MLMNMEKGIRNFTATANHTQYRTRALLLRKANASSAATPTTIVDCQR
jgi:hypothetical protein